MVDDSEVEELGAFITSKGSAGIGYDALFDSGSFESRADLSRSLHLLSQQGAVFKRDGLYFGVGVTPVAKVVEVVPKRIPPPSSPAVSPPSSPAVSPPKSEQPVVTPETSKEDFPFGNVRRTSLGVGSLAFSLYATRKQAFVTREELTRLSGIPAVRFSTVMSQLVAQGYAEKEARPGSSKHLHIYKWSGKFRYPFSSMKTTDAALLVGSLNPIKVESPKDLPAGDPILAARSSLTPYPSSSSGDLGLDTSSTPISGALLVIETSIAHYEHQLSVLREIKTHLLRT